MSPQAAPIRATAIDAAANDSEAAVRTAVAAFAGGGLVVVSDDDDRENEADLFVAAALCTPATMAFIIRHTSGIVCAPLTSRDARRLHLDPMVAVNDAPLGTAFTVSVDVRQGLTTGISADQRTNTVRALADPGLTAADFVRPGHVFPLVGREGGVLMRSGHTEACIDLCRLAGLPAVGVLAELMNDDGTVMHGPQVADFAARHGLPLLSIAELIGYCQARDRLVRRVATFPVPSEIGELTGHSFVTPFDNVHHFAFVLGDLGDGRAVPTRLHRANVVADTFGGAKDIRAALARFRAEGRGVLICLRDGTGGIPLQVPTDSPASGSELARRRRWREVGLGAQILRDLGVVSIRNMSSQDLLYVGVKGFGLEIASTERLET